MRWPWVSRHYLELQKDFDKEILQALGIRLAKAEAELEYYRARAEAEKDRADRAVDALVQWVGREPISQATEKTHEPARIAAKEMQEQMAEVFSDVAESILGEETEKEKEPAIKSVEERLAELRLLPRYQKQKTATANSTGESGTSGSKLSE